MECAADHILVRLVIRPYRPLAAPEDSGGPKLAAPIPVPSPEVLLGVAAGPGVPSGGGALAGQRKSPPLAAGGLSPRAHESAVKKSWARSSEAYSS
jgi:hypothetical protein